MYIGLFGLFSTFQMLNDLGSFTQNSTSMNFIVFKKFSNYIIIYSMAGKTAEEIQHIPSTSSEQAEKSPEN